MPANRNYSATAVVTALTSAVSSSATTIAVGATTGFPVPPFALVLDKDRPTEEAVLVTNVVGLTLTVTRGYDSTPAVPHDAGASATHAFLAIDAREAANHVGSSSGVHGLNGSVVGTSDVQTLDNKTFLSATGSAPAIVAKAQTGQTVDVFRVVSDTNATVIGLKQSGRIAAKGLDGSDTSTLTAGAAGTVPLVVKGAASQTANLLNVVDSNNAVKASVDAAGNITSTASVNGAAGTFSGTLTAGTVTTSGAVNAASGSVTGTLTAGVLTGKDLSITDSGGTEKAGVNASLQFFHGNSVIPWSFYATTVTVALNNVTNDSTPLTFPVGRFTQAPLVFATVSNAPGGSNTFVPRAINTTTSGTNIYIYTGDGSRQTATVTVSVLAIQMLTGSASG